MTTAEDNDVTMQMSVEQRLFRDTSAEFIQERASIPATRALSKQGEAYDREWWATATEFGWTALLVPEDLGGGSASGEGVIDLVTIVEMLGAHVSPGPLSVVSTVIAGLTHPAATGEREDLIQALLAGEKVATWAVQAPGADWAPLEPAATATRTAGGWMLEGSARSVEFARESDVMAVVARTDDGVITLLVPRDADGVAITGGDSVDLVRKFGDVTFSGVAVKAQDVVAEESAAPEIIAYQARVMNLLQVAEAIGAIGKVFDFTVQWGFDRYSFGRPLVAYQALKHRYADALLWLEASRAIVAAAARAVQEDRADAQLLVSSAKSYVGDRGVQIIQDCVQLHGGLGVTMDHDLNVYLRRVMVARQTYGTPRDHREVIADLTGL
ncbi:acyl-CoA dehydrogenase family protein [Microbacterium sp.]|uniref:acyl-CoA dehydrogenase family protein n=1 Tax=Microbacterium sp. TaxID=51671 RepID=UPI002D7F8FE3|nr:acyl-CoA dehydrogenase family protein [Microbacterium sp.]